MKILLESTTQPGLTRLFTRYEARVLVRLGRWRHPDGGAAVSTPAPAGKEATPPRRTAPPAPPAEEAEDFSKQHPGHKAFDDLVELHGSLEAAPVRELEDVADVYGFEAGDIEGTGAANNVVKADWLRELQQRRNADRPPRGTYLRRDMQAE